MNSDLFIEIKEELRREKFYKVLFKLAPWLAGLAGLLIIFTIILTWQEKVNLRDQNAMSEIFYKALAIERLGKTDAALESYNYLIDNHLDSYASLAALKKAAISVERKDFDAAYKVYEELTKQNSTNKIIKYFAETKMAIILSNNQISKEVDFEQMLDKLQNQENPWRGMALEMKVLWLINANQTEKSIALIDLAQSDSALLGSIKQRLNAVKAVISRSDDE